jgi:hypothetical protein
VMLLLWSCAASQPESGHDTAGSCGPQSLVEQGCPIDTCALECSSVATGMSRCLDTYRRGNFDAYNLDRLTSGCSGTDCDPDQYLSPEASLCIAQVHGLESGIRVCGSTFEFTGSDARWTNWNTVVYGCTDGREVADVGYGVIQIDARTGAYMDTLEMIGLAECPE